MQKKKLTKKHLIFIFLLPFIILSRMKKKLSILSHNTTFRTKKIDFFFWLRSFVFHFNFLSIDSGVSFNWTLLAGNHPLVTFLMNFESSILTSPYNHCLKKTINSYMKKSHACIWFLFVSIWFCCPNSNN